MGSRIHGITVTLYEKTQSGTDDFGRPVYTETPVQVDNVIVGEPMGTEAIDTLNLTGKRLAYNLGIPKGDTHTWTDRRIDFFGQSFRAIAAPTEGIEDLVPLQWNRKIQVERYE